MRIESLVMVTPFGASISSLSEADQLILIKGCVLCQITRDVANDSVRSKAEWKSCRSELGVPIEVLTIDRVDARVREAIADHAPAVVARTEDGRYELLMDEETLERCQGSVTDFRGRLLYRLSALGLSID